jgi:hypothetical protein
MPHEEPSGDRPAAPIPPPVHAGHAPPIAYEPITEEADWPEESEELPPRPRRRISSPLPLTLLAVLLLALGFIGGVLVEKGQASPSTAATSGTGAASGLLSRLRALRSGGALAGSGAPSNGAAGTAGTGFNAPTQGTVAYLSGDTLYVTNGEGNTIRVTTSAATSVTKTVNTTVRAIHPGETVTVTGASGSHGAIAAESIRVGGGGAGSLAALFSGSSGNHRASSAGATGGEGSKGGEPALFGAG